MPTLINKLLLLPLTQQALTQEFHEKSIDELLDGSLRLLDLCNRAKDALLQTKELVHQLQSVLRRKRGSEIEEYLFSRKKVKTTIHKAINSLESHTINKNHVSLTSISMLKEVQAATLSVFESLLRFIAGPKSSNWSLVSRLIKNQKRVICDDQEMERNEFEVVDDALQSLVRHNTSKSDGLISVENLQKKLGKWELSIQDLEEGVENLYKCLIKTRVSLNIFSH